jgi:hypothetical protein
MSWNEREGNGREKERKNQGFLRQCTPSIESCWITFDNDCQVDTTSSNKLMIKSIYINNWVVLTQFNNWKCFFFVQQRRRLSVTSWLLWTSPRRRLHRFLFVLQNWIPLP